LVKHHQQCYETIQVGNNYGLTRNAKHLHLRKINGLLYLNLEDFIKDLKDAIDKYIIELRNDSDVKRNALSWYSKNKIISLNT
jgi:DNA replication initiation complex subunit (GINS family)